MQLDLERQSGRIDLARAGMVVDSLREGLTLVGLTPRCVDDPDEWSIGFKLLTNARERSVYIEAHRSSLAEDAVDFSLVWAGGPPQLSERLECLRWLTGLTSHRDRMGIHLKATASSLLPEIRPSSHNDINQQNVVPSETANLTLIDSGPPSLTRGGPTVFIASTLGRSNRWFGDIGDFADRLKTGAVDSQGSSRRHFSFVASPLTAGQRGAYGPSLPRDPLYESVGFIVLVGASSRTEVSALYAAELGVPTLVLHTEGFSSELSTAFSYASIRHDHVGSRAEALSSASKFLWANREALRRRWVKLDEMSRLSMDRIFERYLNVGRSAFRSSRISYERAMVFVSSPLRWNQASGATRFEIARALGMENFEREVDALGLGHAQRDPAGNWWPSGMVSLLEAGEVLGLDDADTARAWERHLERQRMQIGAPRTDAPLSIEYWATVAEESG